MKTLLGIFAAMVSTGTAQSAYAISEDYILIDVRTPEEYTQGHIDKSINIDLFDNQFKSKISKLDKSKTYKLYCRSGNRSGQAERIMLSLGFRNVENAGGLQQAARYLKRNLVQN